MWNPTRKLRHQTDMTRDAESALVEKARLGDREAFGALWEASLGTVTGFLSKQLERRPEDVEDIVSKCAIKALAKIADFKGTCSFSTWLCTVAMRVLADFFRETNGRSKKTGGRISVNMETAEIAVNEHSREVSFEEGSGWRIFLEKVDKTLTPREAKVKELLMLGHTPDEIAAQIGTSVSKVYYALTRIKEKARQVITNKKSQQPGSSRGNLPRSRSNSAGP